MAEAQDIFEQSQLVYVRPVAGADILSDLGEEQIREQGLYIDENDTLYAVHLEDGTRMAVFSDRTHAFAAARQHGAEPVSVH